jgi:hypothetical protein
MPLRIRWPSWPSCLTAWVVGSREDEYEGFHRVWKGIDRHLTFLLRTQHAAEEDTPHGRSMVGEPSGEPSMASGTWQ